MVEPTHTPKRVWLKAVDSNGTVIIVRNIARAAITTERNRMAEEYTATGDYDEVIAEAIDKAVELP